MTVFSTPDLCDVYADQLRVLEPVFNNYGGHAQFYGEVVTVKCFEDNSVSRDMIATPGGGRVMVIDGGGSLRRALLGDILAEKAADNGWAGFVIYGCIRDCDQIAVTSIGVKALNIIPRATNRKGIGEANVPVTFAGQTIQNGDWLYADNNGVVVSESKLDLAKLIGS